MKTPYTDKEKIVADALILAWNSFCELERMHPDEIDDFRKGIHDLQYVLGMRTLRREYPETYPTYTK